MSKKPHGIRVAASVVLAYLIYTIINALIFRSVSHPKLVMMTLVVYMLTIFFLLIPYANNINRKLMGHPWLVNFVAISLILVPIPFYLKVSHNETILSPYVLGFVLALNIKFNYNGISKIKYYLPLIIAYSALVIFIMLWTGIFYNAIVGVSSAG